MQALRDRLATRPAYAWLKFVTLDKLDDNAAVLTPTPGHRDVLSFARDPRRLQSLTEELAPILGRRVRVSIQPPSPANPGHHEPNAQSPNPQSPTPNNAANRRAAMDLPLVKQVMDIFPDAVLFDLREEE
jgi:hypothetical protein